jgi:ribosomal protein S18 acetylase RimI-like enzyme
MNVEEITVDGEKAGILCTYNNYIDCIYIMPKFRRRGIASKTAVEFVRKKGEGVRLAIINNNTPALAFWNRLFVLWRIDGNHIDTLYEIVKIKPKIEREYARKEIKEGMILQTWGGNDEKRILREQAKEDD